MLSADSDLSEYRALGDSSEASEKSEAREESVRDVQPSAREFITASGLFYLLRFGRFQRETELPEGNILAERGSSGETEPQIQKSEIKENKNGSEL